MNLIETFLNKLDVSCPYFGGFYKLKCPEGKRHISINPEGSWECEGSQEKYCEYSCPKSGNIRELFKILFFEYEFNRIMKK